MGWNAADYNFTNYADYLIPGTNQLSDAGKAERDRLTAARIAATAKEQAKGRRLVNIGKLATLGITGAGAGLAAFGPAAAGGAAASSSAIPASFGSAGAYTGPAISAGGGAAKSTMPWMRIAELATGLFSNWRGNKAQSKADDREFDYRSAADQRAYDQQQAIEAERKREWDLQQAQIQKDYEARQEQDRLDRLAEEADRKLKEEDLRRGWAVTDARESQRGPYRQAGQIAIRDLVGGLR